MTTPSERTRALRQARELVDMILEREDLPEDIRLKAMGVDRHFPSVADIESRARNWESPINDRWLAPEDPV